MLQLGWGVIALALIPVFSVLVLRDTGWDAGKIAAFATVYFLVAWIVASKVREIRRLNRFGIYAAEIAPPRKPRSRTNVVGRLVIPYSSIAELEYWTMGAGQYPDAPFGARIRLTDGAQVDVDVSDIVVQARGNQQAVVAAQVAVRALAREFNEWRRATHAKPFVFAGGVGSTDGAARPSVTSATTLNAPARLYKVTVLIMGIAWLILSGVSVYLSLWSGVPLLYALLFILSSWAVITLWLRSVRVMR